MTTGVRPGPGSVQLPLALAAAGLSVFAAIAMFGAAKPLMLVALPAAVAALLVIAQRPTASLVLIIVIEVTNVSGVLAPHARLPLFQASLGLGALAVALAARDAQLRRRLRGWPVVAALLLGCHLITQGLAALGSTNVPASLSYLERAVTDCAFLMIVLMLMLITGSVWTAAAAFVIPMAVMSVLTLLNQVVFGGANDFGGFATVTHALGEDITTLRYGGPLPDSNFWGRHLVMALPLAGALVVRARRNRVVWPVIGWSVTTAMLLAGIYLTQSRGTFLATLVAAAAWAVVSGRAGRKWGLIVAPILILAALLAPGIGNRLTSAVSEINNADVSAATVDPSLLGRLAAQEMAARMFAERPVFGYGPAAFVDHVDEFADQLSTAVRPELPDRQPIEAPHNIYLGMASESGAVGVAGWLTMVAGFLMILLLRLIADPRGPDRVLVAAVFAAIMAWSAASVMLHLAYFRTFGLVLMMAVALAPQWPAPADALRILLRRGAITVTAIVVGTGIGWSVLSAQRTTEIEASQRVVLMPQGEIDGYYAWALDLRGRPGVVSTVAKVLTPPGATVIGDPVRGLLTYSASNADADRATSAVASAVSQARGLLQTDSGDQQFELTELEQISTRTEARYSRAAVLSAAGAGVASALATALSLSWLLHRRRRRGVPA